MGSLFEDLANAPKRKPSAKRSQQDAANFRAAQESRWEKMAQDAKDESSEIDNFRKEGVDWGIEFGEIADPGDENA